MNGLNLQRNFPSQHIRQLHEITTVAIDLMTQRKKNWKYPKMQSGYRKNQCTELKERPCEISTNCFASIT